MPGDANAGGGELTDGFPAALAELAENLRLSGNETVRARALVTLGDAWEEDQKKSRAVEMGQQEPELVRVPGCTAVVRVAVSLERSEMQPGTEAAG
eukprot:CAMPEP_0172603736 /NCGR_PEP_ID=MMETSP1068-20121228/23993_1 /TAXON_ID=35684 /ORGANISM="Pseudopedinella elastica, Strain CCMP716" /LENGTH=95 /DNA_ID=CAMNT_0013405587 /DNA_START=189 /DNA_END=472 /DNA_ORIENTATION=-